MNWYIGQEIVVIKSQSKFIEKGETYTIKSLIECPCSCGGVNIYIGKNWSKDYIGYCICCHAKKEFPAGPIYFHESYFTPLDELADISELTEILKQPAFS